MWREALRVWYVSLTQNPLNTLSFFLILTLANSFLILPLLGQASFLLGSYVIFSRVVFVSRAYIGSKGDLEEFKESIKRTGLLKSLLSYVPETVAVLVAQFLLTTSVGLIALFILLLSGLWAVVVPLLEGGTVNWKLLVLALLLGFFLYFSILSSFPLFFGRAVLRGRGFRGTLSMFLSSLWAELTWKTLINWDYIKSSFIICALTLMLLLLHLLLLLSPLYMLGSVLTFLTVYLSYTFGTVACFRLLRS